ncbi:MAG: bacteriocin-protection protein YdeI/OmpD-associated family [Bacteroidetes bacterium]|nr:bacteriocin-protection protein YdeI/OmpD-associated family [Bacteroidota bacterium]
MINENENENKAVKPDLPILAFNTPQEFTSWLANNHTISAGIWIRLFKIKSGVPTITYAQALDVALCYGWIDGQKKVYDTESWLQKFTPRRNKSIWSKRNQEHVERLTKLGMMEAAGIKEVEAAKADGRWEQAYESSSNMVVPPDFLNELTKDKKAEAFFKTLNKTNIYSIVWRLQTAKKPETRTKRMQVILEMLKKGEKFH